MYPAANTPPNPSHARSLRIGGTPGGASTRPTSPTKIRAPSPNRRSTSTEANEPARSDDVRLMPYTRATSEATEPAGRKCRNIPMNESRTTPR